MVSQETFGEPWSERNPNRVRLSHPAMVVYGHPDLDKAHEFASNFGLREVGRSADGCTISYAGYGTQPVCYVAKQTDVPKHLGYFFEASSEDDLEKAAKVPGAGPITPLDLPGGGKAVTITDPSGCLFGVVYGVEKKSSGTTTEDVLPLNVPADTDSDQEKKPRKGKFQRNYSILDASGFGC
jgi:predicted enzyme related to lactoylglutathione lyase